MKLDKRILPGKRPLTCYDIEEARKHVGKLCYICDEYDFFTKLTLTEKTILTSVEDCEVPFHYELDKQAEFCLPCEWVEEEKKEPKYRPYTIKDFEKAFLDGEYEDFIIFRDKHDPDNIYTMRYNGNFKRGEHEYICLGAKNFSFESLFENYEVADYDGNWQPFGIEEEE